MGYLAQYKERCTDEFASCPPSAVPASLERGQQFFADIELNQMDEMGRTALTWLAQQGAGHWAEVAAFVAILPEHKASETLLRLSQRKLLKANHGKFMIAVELIRRWFAITS